MEQYITVSDFDFTVKRIGHVVERAPNINWRIDNLANNDFYIIAYAINGEAFYNFEEKHYHIKEGDLVFFPKAFVHSAISNPKNPWSFCSISFDLDFADKSSQLRLDSISNYISCSNPFKMTSLLSELNNIWTGKRSGYLLKCRSLILDVLYQIIWDLDRINTQTPHSQEIERIIKFLHNNYMYSYSIDDLAKLMGISSCYFRLLFKKVAGCTAIQYQNNIKINKAKDLLLCGECNVTQAALSVGFSDIYYFSKLFKKITGTNPSDYIK